MTCAPVAPRRRSGGGGGGRQAAKNALGQPIKAAEWLATHQPGDRQLTQGLQARRSARVARARGDAAYRATGVAVRVTATTAAAGTALAAAARSVAYRCAFASRPAAARAVVCATARQLIRAATHLRWRYVGRRHVPHRERRRHACGLWLERGVHAPRLRGAVEQGAACGAAAHVALFFSKLRLTHLPCARRRTSSSAPATARSTTWRARWSKGPPRWCVCAARACVQSIFRFSGTADVRRCRRQSLALAHVAVDEDGGVMFSPWTETDFRCARGIDRVRRGHVRLCCCARTAC